MYSDQNLIRWLLIIEWVSSATTVRVPLMELFKAFEQTPIYSECSSGTDEENIFLKAIYHVSVKIFIKFLNRTIKTENKHMFAI